MVARPQPSQMAHVSTRCFKECREEDDRAMKTLHEPGATVVLPGKGTGVQPKEMYKQLRVYGLSPHKTLP